MFLYSPQKPSEDPWCSLQARISLDMEAFAQSAAPQLSTGGRCIPSLSTFM